MAIKSETIRLKWQKFITPNTRHMAFEREGGEPIEFIPGQFITLHLPHQDKEVRRSYSLATMPGQSGLVEFAISYVEGGIASELLFNLEQGDGVKMTGPFGRFVLRDEQPKRYVLIATGTGVVPYLAMLPGLSDRLANPDLSVELLLGVQRREDLLYGEDFLAMDKKYDNFSFNAYYSRENPEDILSFENHGRLQTGFERLNLDPNGDIVYLCGNPDMIDDSFNRLKELGFTPSNVRREKYISSK